MKYICVRIVYPDTLHETPCQSLIGIHGTLEYEPNFSAAVISDSFPDNFDLFIPMTQDQYTEFVNVIKVKDLVDTNLYAFYYEEDDFELMYNVVLERNKNMEIY